jgi:isopentenyl diphosphate isomerase/L-lactate dehydrogenase-like FMN-dependent dehydrogenase
MAPLPVWTRWRILCRVCFECVCPILGAKANCCAAVGDKTYIMYDSGIRGASDVVKALALGAKFVFVGRLWVWGLSIMGEHGVRHVMKSLLADLDILFNVAGIQEVSQIDKSWLESYPKSYTLIQERSKL